MMALIETSSPGKGRRCREYNEEISVAGVQVVRHVMEIPERAGKRSVKRCIMRSLGFLASSGEVSLCFKEDFPYKEEFLTFGFKEAGCGSLIRAKAGEIITSAAQKKNVSFVALDRLGPDDRRAVITLCNEFRYVEVSGLDWIYEKLCGILEPLGVSPVRARAGRSRADAAIILSKPVDPVEFSASCAVLPLWGDGGFTGGRCVQSVKFIKPGRLNNLPEGYPCDVLISRAVECGIVTPDEIAVGDVRLEE